MEKVIYTGRQLLSYIIKEKEFCIWNSSLSWRSTDAYLEPSRISTMEDFCENI